MSGLGGTTRTDTRGSGLVEATDDRQAPPQADLAEPPKIEPRRAGRFEYPFQSRYATVDGVRVHYLDEGEGPPIWMMHGNTTWSYLYRKMIPPLVQAGFRCIVPDLMGFGLSDKPEDEREYSVQRHVSQMTRLLDRLEVRGLTVVGQDWGGPITLRYAIEHKDNVRALVLLNTFVQRFPANARERQRLDIVTSPLPLPFALLFKSGTLSSVLVRRLDLLRKFVWARWKTGNASRLGAGVRRPMDPRAIENYLSVHDTPAKRAGLAAFPKMIPDCADHPNAPYINQIRRELGDWRVPLLVLWPDGDMAWKPDEGTRIARLAPMGEHYVVRNAGHFVQEDAGEEVATQVTRFLARHLSKPAIPV